MKWFCLVCSVITLALVPCASSFSNSGDCTLAESGYLELEKAPAHIAGGPATGYLARTSTTDLLTVVDLGTPPTVLGEWSPPNHSLPNSVSDLAVYDNGGDTVQVAMTGRYRGANQPGQLGWYNLVIRVDVSDPSMPVAMDTTTVSVGGLVDVTFDDEGELFAGSGRVPVAPWFTAVDRNQATLLPGDAIKDMLIRDGLAYIIVSATPSLLCVVDTDSLDVLSTTVISGSPQEMDLRDDGVLFVADGVVGIRSCDVSDPHAPVVLGSATGNSIGRDIAVAGDRAYLTTVAPGELQVYDVSDPANPVCIGGLPGGGTDLLLSGSRAFLSADPDGVPDDPPGLYVIDARDCMSTTGLTETPRPSAALRITPNVLRAGPARIRLTTSGNGRTPSLRAVDVAGRVVGRIALVETGPGVWSATWSPHTDTGRPLPSGKYWIAGEDVAESVVLLR